MKSIALFASLMAAGAAVASSVSSTTTFGVLKIASTSKETVICVPWVKAGTTTGEAVLVKDAIKTSNLLAGDSLLKYNPSNGKYLGWSLSSNGGTWTGAYVVSDGGTSDKGTDLDELARGDALILVRTGTVEQIAARTDSNIYLYGQYIADSVGEKTLSLNAWNLIAPPSTTGSTLSLNDGSKLEWSNIGASDIIYVQAANGNRIKLNRNSANTQWVYKKIGGDSSTEAVVQPGQGFWFVSKETTGSAPTVNIK